MSQSEQTIDRPKGDGWDDTKNERRCDLVDREIEGTLLPAEKRELEDLQSQMLAYRRKVAPLPVDWAAKTLADLQEFQSPVLNESMPADDEPSCWKTTDHATPSYSAGRDRPTRPDGDDMEALCLAAFDRGDRTTLQQVIDEVQAKLRREEAMKMFKRVDRLKARSDIPWWGVLVAVILAVLCVALLAAWCLWGGVLWLVVFGLILVTAVWRAG